MKLLLLNIHLEKNHNRLKKMIELDARPGMDNVFLEMYDYEGFKKKKLVEGQLPGKPALGQPGPAPVAPPMRFELSEEEEESVDDPTWSPAASSFSRTSWTPPQKTANKFSPLPPARRSMTVLKTEPSVPFIRPMLEIPAYTIISSVSMSFPCLLCNDKAGRDLRLVGERTSDVTEHYKLCLFNLGRLQALMPPQAINTNSEGRAIDEMGHK